MAKYIALVFNQYPSITEETIAKYSGYLGALMLILAHWLLIPQLYIFGFIGLLVQTYYRKNWALVAVQLNGLIAWLFHYLV